MGNLENAEAKITKISFLVKESPIKQFASGPKKALAF